MERATAQSTNSTTNCPHAYAHLVQTSGALGLGLGVPGCPAQKKSCCETSGYPPCPVLTDVPLYRDIPSGHHFNKTWFVKHTLFPPIEIGRGYIPWYVGSATHLSSRPMSSLLLAGKPESRFETQNFGSIVNQGTYTYAGNYTK